MGKFRIFSKREIASLIIIFTILIAISIPNFMASLRRARDQTRRDDLGILVHYLDEYYREFSAFPLSSPDGKIMDCLKPGDKPYKNDEGFWVFDAIPCEWGKDSFTNLLSGTRYIDVLPRDPNWEKGASYKYLSDGVTYQLFSYMEGKTEAEVDINIVSLGYMCGTTICNVGRYYGCQIPKTLTQCALERIPKRK